MANSKVYYMDAHSETVETSIVAKMLTVFDAAGLDEMIKKVFMEDPKLVQPQITKLAHSWKQKK